MDDIEAYLVHSAASSSESGRDGDVYFGPYRRDEPFVVEEARERTRQRWSKSITTTGWRRAWGAFEGDRCIGTGAYYPTLNWIMNLVVRRDRRRRGTASALLRSLWAHLGDDVKDVRMVNVDHRDAGMQRFLERSGFTLFTRQYEMELTIDAAPLS